MSRHQSDSMSTSWRREFGVVKTPQTRPWQIPMYETEGGWEHLVGLSAEEICWQLENPSLDVRAEINARRWQKEKTQRQLQRRVKQWPEASVQRRVETRKFHAARKSARERERSRGGALRSAGQALTLRRDLEDAALHSRSSVGAAAGDDDSSAGTALALASTSASLRQHPIGFRDDVYLRAFEAPDPEADDVLKRDGRLCKMCGHVVQSAVYTKHLDACRSTARHLRDEPWKDRTAVWVPCPHCGDEFREALFRSHVQSCAARQRARGNKQPSRRPQPRAAAAAPTPISRFATEEERELYHQDREVYVRIEELKPLLAAAVAAQDMGAVQRIHWDLRALYDRRRHLHSVGDEVARRVNAALKDKRTAEVTARESKARKRKLQLLRRPRRASIEIQRWARGFLVRLRQRRREQLWRELVAEDEERELAKIANLGVAGSEVLRPPHEERTQTRGVLLLEDGTPAYNSVVRLQSFARGLAGRRVLWSHRAAVQIQRWYRHTMSVRQWANVVTSQPGAVSPATRSRLHNLYTTSEYRRHRAALRIQSMMRNGVLRRQVGKLRGCAVRIQALVRSNQARAVLDRQLLAAYRIQQWYRWRLAVRSAIARSDGSSVQSARWFRDLRVKSRKLRVRDRSLIGDRLFAALTRQKQRERSGGGSGGASGGAPAAGVSASAKGGVASSVLSLLHRKYRRPRKAAHDGAGASSSASAAGTKASKRLVAKEALSKGEGGVDRERVMKHMKLYRLRQGTEVVVPEAKRVDPHRRLAERAVRLGKRGPRVPEDAVDLDPASATADTEAAKRSQATAVAALKPKAAGGRLRGAVKKAMTPKQFFESIAEWFRNIGKKPKPPSSKSANVDNGNGNGGGSSKSARSDALAAFAPSSQVKESKEPSHQSTEGGADAVKPEHKVRGGRKALRRAMSNDMRAIGDVEHRSSIVPHERSKSQRNRELRRRVSNAGQQTDVRSEQQLASIVDAKDTTATTTAFTSSSSSSRSDDASPDKADPAFPFGRPTRLFGAWSRYQDPATGRPFFYNENTDTSTWQRPATPPGGRSYSSSSRALAAAEEEEQVSGEERGGPWASARRHKPRGFGRHQLSQELELVEMDERAGQGKPRAAGAHAAGRQSASVAPLSLVQSQRSASSPSQRRRLQGVVKRRLMKKGDKLSFQDAVKLKGFGQAIADLPSTVKMVAAFKKFGEILARPFSKDKYFRNKGKQVDRVKARHGPAV